MFSRPGEIRIEPDAQFQHGLNAALHSHGPARGSQHVGDQLEQRALAAAVAPDEADPFPGADLDGHIVQGDHLPVDGQATLCRRNVRAACARRLPG